MLEYSDMVIAYRKAKVDAFYSTIKDRIAFMQYEQNLHENLTRLFEEISSGNESLSDVGTWVVVPKSIGKRTEDEDIVANTVFSDPQKAWDMKYTCFHKDNQAVFRLMARPSIDFHVLSALWISNVGTHFDKILSDDSYGNRLRRTKDGEINPLSSGSIKPYMRNFRNWKTNAISKIKDALRENTSLITLTADIESYYHELNPSFMLRSDFMLKCGIRLNVSENKLNKFFIKSMTKWAQGTPLKKGLPVGLAASAVIANVALHDLDNVIKENLAPLYYGRYVDDIILVMPNGKKIDSAEQVWKFIVSNSNRLLNLREGKVYFSPKYFKSDRIAFSQKKCKIFFLEKHHGLTMMNSIEKHMRERSSEWRSLPDLPTSIEGIDTDLVEAMQKDGEFADNLRLADSVSLRKSRLAMKLRDYEACANDLRPKAWQSYRHAFINTFIEHILVLPNVFTFYNYLPRVIGMVVSCGDFSSLKKILIALERILNDLDNKKYFKATIKAFPKKSNLDEINIFECWSEELKRLIDETIKASIPQSLTQEAIDNWNGLFSNGLSLLITPRIDELIKNQKELFERDLAYVAFKYSILPIDIAPQCLSVGEHSSFAQISEEELAYSEIFKGVNNIVFASGYFRERGAEEIYNHDSETGIDQSTDVKKCVPCGLAFATRPMTIAELFLLCDPKSKAINLLLPSAILALRGFHADALLPIYEKDKGVVKIVDKQKHSGKYKIAIVSWKTEHASWIASVTGDIDQDNSRYNRLTSLINAIIKCDNGIDYVVFPELSIPARWFIRIANKLHKQGISLLCGIEYLHSVDVLHNQVWVALGCNTDIYNAFVIYRQDKQQSALHEEEALHNYGEKKLGPQMTWNVPPIIAHGEFRFAILICSELTNIAYRSQLRGKIDALFVPEWNQDIVSFNALVEASAIDIHAYIIQCNDREYGDSRIRSPYKDDWRRDIVRLKGGEHDFYAIGEIDVAALRRFQSFHHSPPQPFKPTPDGFKIHPDRRMMPEP